MSVRMPGLCHPRHHKREGPATPVVGGVMRNPGDIAAVVLQDVFCPAGVVGGVIDRSGNAGEGIGCKQRCIAQEYQLGNAAGFAMGVVIADEHIGIYNQNALRQGQHNLAALGLHDGHAAILQRLAQTLHRGAGEFG